MEMHRHERRLGRRHSGFGSLLVGLIIAGIGVLLLLENLGVVYVEDVWRYWPVILIVMGISRAASCYGMGGRVWGGMLVLGGTVFLLSNLGFIRGDVWRFFWPVILIGIGIAMLGRAFERRAQLAKGTAINSGVGRSTDSTLNEWAIFGGARRRVESQEFQGGDVLAIFGGVELDLHQAAIKGDEAVIEANAMFGGVDIRVPETWTVTVRGSGIFGGYEDKTAAPRTDEIGKRPMLVITGFAVFGGVTVKN